MRFNALIGIIAGLFISSANAAIYTFENSGTTFASLEVSEVTSTSFNFSLNFLSSTPGISANHFIKFLGVDDVNNISASTATSFTPIGIIDNITIGGTSFSAAYDFDFTFPNGGGAGTASRFNVGDSATWTTDFLSAPGGFNEFSLAVLNNGGNGRINTVGVLQAAPVPEPETYAMLIAGLGLLSLKRFKQRKK